MNDRRTQRSTRLFIAFLLLGGLLHFFDRDDYALVPDTLIYCLSLTIYAGLIFLWIQKVRDRLIRSRSRSYTLAAAGMMLLYLTVRTLKYRIYVSPLITRLFWYLYYVPQIMIPTLFLMTAVRFYSDRSRSGELALLVPAALLTGAVLTNDMHFLAFVPRIEAALLTGVTGTYSYGILYWMYMPGSGCASSSAYFSCCGRRHACTSGSAAFCRSCSSRLSPCSFPSTAR